MTYQKVTGPLMANSHPGSYSGQDAYTDMFVTENKDVEILEQRRNIADIDSEKLWGGSKNA